MDNQFIIDWFNTWPIDITVFEWIQPRFLIIAGILYFLKIITKLTPWAWDNVIVAAIDGVFGMFTKSKTAEKKPISSEYKEIN